jgi:5-methylcytosine-specific restriction endonuclease McrA
MVCGAKFLRFPHEIEDGQRYFCSTKCAAQFRANKKLNDSATTPQIQKKKILATRPHKCQRCGYDKIPEILVIHHVDHNRMNGDPENLELLCPNCHAEEHFILKTGWFRPHTKNDMQKLIEHHQAPPS